MSAPSLPGWLILIYLSTDQELDVLCSQLQMSGPSLPDWLILVFYLSVNRPRDQRQNSNRVIWKLALGVFTASHVSPSSSHSLLQM